MTYIKSLGHKWYLHQRAKTYVEYTGDHIVWVGPWQDFTFDLINEKLKVVQKQMIYHLKPLIVGF